MNTPTRYSLFRSRCSAIASCADSIAFRASFSRNVRVMHDARLVGALMRFPSAAFNPDQAIAKLRTLRANLANA